MKLSNLKSESGSSMVEFAMIAPVFAFLLLGMTEMSRYTYYAILTAHAARAAVQYGAQNVVSAANLTGMTSAAKLDAPGVTMSVTPAHYCQLNNAANTCSSQPSSTNVYYVQVTVTETVNSLFHYPGLPSSLPISSTVSMRVSQQ